MFDLFKRPKKNKIWDFKGGIYPPEMKSQSSGTPLRQVPLPRKLIIPLKQHLGDEGELLVRVGDSVLRGQQLTMATGSVLPVHASTSGKVIALTSHPGAHPSGLEESVVIIEADGADCWMERHPWPDYQQYSRETVIDRIHQYGVAGLGGAGFPTASKLRSGEGKINTLIINAAECEPYITADDRLMQDCAAQIIEGIRILSWILKPQRILIGIEDNKPQAISMLRAVLTDDHAIELRVIPTKYPSGGAKQLTQILTGKQVPLGGRSADIGVLMQNVGTVYAIKRAVIDGEPLTERVITLTGNALMHPGNVWARLGTPVQHLLNFAGFQPGQQQQVIMGGPLMGFNVTQLDIPVVKITNCLLAPSPTELGNPLPEQHCIRCSACADTCPADLLPQQLYWFSLGQQHDKANTHHIHSCIECGACAWVCPSNIPLVHYFRQEKAELRDIARVTRRAQQARIRFEARQKRLEKEKAARLVRHKQVAAQPDAGSIDAIEAALLRVKKKQGTGQLIVIQAGSMPDNRAVIAARKARKAQHTNQRTVQEETISSTFELNVSDNGARYKADAQTAIARVQARKASAGNSPASASTPDNAEDSDTRKAAVQAAIARVQARKASAGNSPASASTPDNAEDSDTRKAAVQAKKIDITIEKQKIDIASVQVTLPAEQAKQRAKEE